MAQMNFGNFASSPFCCGKAAEGMKMPFYSSLCVTFSEILRCFCQALLTLSRVRNKKSSKVLKITLKLEIWFLSERIVFSYIKKGRPSGSYTTLNIRRCHMANNNLILLTMNNIFNISVENYICKNFNNIFLSKKYKF